MGNYLFSPILPIVPILAGEMYANLFYVQMNDIRSKKSQFSRKL